jgi:CRISPR-associated endoribonuclease Cas6
MQQEKLPSSSSAAIEQGELYSLLLRLHPVEAGTVSAGLGRQAHAAFLDIVRQNDPELAEQLHQPNQRRPFTVGLLQGFNHLSSAQQDEAMAKNTALPVQRGQIYWLRITILDAGIFKTFVRHLLLHPQTFTIRLDEARFEVSRLIVSPETEQQEHAWVSYSSFARLSELTSAQRHYTFEFATPTAFSLGQKSWGKYFHLFPEATYVFESLAKQWEAFAPEPLKMGEKGLRPFDLASWCEENIIATHYALKTLALPTSKFGQSGFLGTITYEVKENKNSSEATWLSPLASLALFSGIGAKTSMGMGQARCINLSEQASTRKRV